jgi:hypothetical protein
MGRTSKRLGLSVLFALMAVSPGALAQDKKQCVDAFEQAQVLRKERKLQAAAEQVLVCAEKKCPLIVRRDCAQWKKDIEASLPSVIFVVRDAAGNPAKGVKIWIDGKELKEGAGETPVPVDPGEHVLRYELPGSEPIEQSVLLREGDKERRLSVAFEASAPPPPPPPPPAPPPVLAFVLGGVGVAGLAAFTTLGVIGKNERDDLAATCAPACSADDVSSVRTKLIAADVSLGVGVASLGVGTFLFVRWLLAKPEAPKPAEAPKTGKRGEGQWAGSLARPAALWIDVRPIEGGGFGQVVGSF